jgi:glycolate oxidase
MACAQVLMEAGATEVRTAQDEAQRRNSGPAARAPSPPSAASRRTTTAWTAPSRASIWPRCCARIAELSSQYGLRVANVFHAGDGNLHPADPVRRQPAGEMQQRRGLRHRHPQAVRRSRRHGHRRTRHRHRKARRPCAASSQRKSWNSSTPSRPPSIRPACSIPARPCRRCIAARSSAACMCRAGLPFPELPRFLDSPADKTRDAWLASQGFRVMRFWNNDVLNQTEAVLESILAALRPPHPHPNPPPSRGREHRDA